MIVADHIGDMMKRAFDRRHTYMGDRCQSCRIQLFYKRVQFFVVLHELLGNSSDQDLIGDSPEADGRMVIVLDDKFFHLADTVLMCFRIFIHHTDKRNLCPDHKSKFVTCVIEILVMLIMCQTDRICSQLFDQLRIMIMLFFAQRVSFIKHILMTAHSAQRRLFSVDDKSFFRIAGEASHTYARVHLVECLVSSLKTCGHGIQIRIVDLPFLCIRHEQFDLRVICRTASACHFLPLCIADRVEHGKVLIAPFCIRYDVKHCAAAVTRCRRHLNSRTSVIFQIEMRVRHADDVHAPGVVGHPHPPDDIGGVLVQQLVQRRDRGRVPDDDRQHGHTGLHRGFLLFPKSKPLRRAGRGGF